MTALITPPSAPLPIATAGLITLALLAAAWQLADGSNQGRAFSFSLLSGALFGLLLQRSRFCFFCVTRDFIERRVPDGLLGLLAALAAWLLRYRQPATGAPRFAGLWSLLFGTRWPTWVGGLLIGSLATLAYLRVGPLGVTAELGSLARTGADGLGWLPQRLEGLDGFSGCATVIKDSLLSNNGLFILGLVFAAWASALAAGDFQPRLPAPREWLRNLLGGVLLGWGSMLALGCTVGTLLSGVMAGAASGWVFGVFCLLGTLLGLKLRALLRLG